MKKKLLLIIIVLLLFCSGCVLKNKTNTSKNTLEKEINSNGYNLSLTKFGNFEKLSYKYPDGVIVNSLGTYTILVYNKEDDTPLFKVGITKFDHTDVDEAMNSSSAVKNGTKNYNNIDWIMYDVDGKNHSYAYKYGYDTYSINFIYDEDLGNFEESFMKNVKFN